MKTGRAGFANVFWLYVFCIATALYPPLAAFALPAIASSFLVIFLSVGYGTAFLNRAITDNVMFRAVGVLFFVYVTWAFVAIFYGNDLAYIRQDSLGFLIYVLTPVIYVYITSNSLQEHFFELILNLCTFLASLSIAIVVWYYVSFGAVESESLLLMNAFIKSKNLNWQVEHNGGVLGLYTHTGHLLLIGAGLSFYRYFVSRKIRYIYLILLYCAGIFADGHRALVVSFLMLIFLLIPLLRQAVTFRKILILLAVLVTLFSIAIVVDSDWIVQRFSFTSDDPSTLERYLQVPALLDRIMERPIFGNGFGSFARVIRSQERPFSYEVDFLATMMKLGIVGCVLYFGAYLYMLNVARRSGGVFGYILCCVGMSFLFYMGTNGNSAMSTDSAVFHMFIFLLIALSSSFKAEGDWLKQRGRSLGVPTLLDDAK
jgi:hypothetical protein